MPEDENDDYATPYSGPHEKSILSTMLKFPETYISRATLENLTADHFHFPAHRILFRRIMATPPEELELVSFCERLNRAGELEDVGGRAGVVEVFTYAPHNQHWTNHVTVLREYLARRRAFEAAEEIRRDAATLEADDIRGMVSRASESVTDALQSRSRLWTAEQAVEALRERMEVARTSATGSVGRPTGLPEIDDVTGGLAPGDLWVVAAKPSEGKSALMIQIAHHFAAHGLRVVVVSLEMQKEKVMGRLGTLEAGTNHTAMTRPKTATSGQTEKIRDALDRISGNWHLAIDDEGARTIEEAGAMVEVARDFLGGVDLVVVDYLQRLRPSPQTRGQKREREVAHMSEGLKSLAMRLSVPVLTGSQLNDDGEVRESRAIGQDPDVMLKIERDGILATKVRDGERDRLFPLWLDGSAQRFTPVNPREKNPDQPDEPGF